MKRVIAGLALATAATLISAVPAQAAAPQAAAAAPGPVAAIKKQFTPGKGVRFIDRATLINGKMHSIAARRTGTYLFGGSSVVASDISGNFNYKKSDFADVGDSDIVKALTTPEHIVSIGKVTYLSGSIWGIFLPEDKTWFKLAAGYPGLIGSLYGQPVNITERGTLGGLLKTGKPVKGGYAGTITEGALQKLSPQYKSAFMTSKPTSAMLKTKISWRLSVDAKGLPTRLVSTFPMKALDATAPKSSSISVDTRYTGWGDKVKIKAPSADQVATKFEDGGDDLPPEITSLKGIGS
jgi:hypothetical protein